MIDTARDRTPSGVGSLPPTTELADSRYVRFTNFRRSGVAVSTPVWIAPFGDELVFSSNPTAGKIKRLRNDPRVELARCDVRGRVRPGTPVHTGTARLLDHAEHDAAAAAMKAKYGWQWIFIGISDVFRRIMRRPHEEAFIAIRLES